MNAAQNERAKLYQLLYTVYTFVKIIVIIILILCVENCSSVLGIYLILYCATEIYELLFMCLILAQRYCFFAPGSGFLISIGQASYECFRFIITIAMTVELCKSKECIFSSQGIIQIILVTLGYFKYALVVLLIFFHCCKFRRSIVLSESTSEIRKSETLMFLRNHKKNVSKAEICPICMDSSENEGVLLDCGHWFHSECLKNWVLLKGSCPVCRKMLLE